MRKKKQSVLAALLIAGSTTLGWAQCQMMVDVDFNQWENNRIYSIADAKTDFGTIKPWTASTYRGIKAPGAASNLIGDVKQTTRISNGTLRAHYTKDDAGGYAGGFLFDPYFDPVDEAYLEYKVKFDDNFFWATGGKLPGLGGSTRGMNSETEGRGAIPSGCKYNTDGWSARLMWRRNRAQTTQPYLILYSYFADKYDESGNANGTRVDGNCGDAIRIFTGLQDNKWYTIRQYIKINTPGQSNGIVTMWIDGVQVFRSTKMKMRNSGKNNLKINALVNNTYRGGSRTDPVWHSPRDEYAFFDDFKVWTGCSNPPNNTTNTPPTGSFSEPVNNTFQEGYNQLYVLVDATDPDGDAISSVALKIDGNDVRTEGVAPYEWGHATSPNTNETLNLGPGNHLFEAVITDSRGASTTISKVITVTEQKAPFSGTPIAIPGTLQFEHFDKGGQGVSYNDNDPDNKGADRSNFRINDGVDIDNGNGSYVIGWTSTGEWLEFTVEVATAGTYEFEFYTSSLNGGGQLGMTADGVSILSGVSVPQTNDWTSYTSFTETVSLDAGVQVLRLNVEQNGFNFDRLEATKLIETAVFDTENELELSIYPNPSENGVYHLSEEVEFQVMNATGVIILEGSSIDVNLTDHPKGVYYLKTQGAIIKLMR